MIQTLSYSSAGAYGTDYLRSAGETQITHQLKAARY
jgi:hypothetical protein